jgi:hypothetical protein
MAALVVAQERGGRRHAIGFCLGAGLPASAMASASALACSLIRRGAGANGQGVNPLARQIAQRLVDQPLALRRETPAKAALSISTVKCDLPVPSSPRWPLWLAESLITARCVGQRRPQVYVRFPRRSGLSCPFGLAATMCNGVKHDKFHGRVTDTGRLCSAPGCDAPANSVRPACAHRGLMARATIAGSASIIFRAFNAGYDFFDGMSRTRSWPRNRRSRDGIPTAARSGPMPGSTRRRAGPILPIRSKRSPSAPAPARWTTRAQDAARRGLTPEDRAAYEALGLGFDADRTALRRRYADLVRRYHPDRNGGDRSLEGKLQRVVAAYDHLRQSAAFR